VLGSEERLEQLVRRHRIERLIVPAPVETETALLRRLRCCRYRGVELVDYRSLYEELMHEIPLERLDESWLLAASLNSSRLHICRLKRAVDVVVALGGLIATAPVLAVAAVLIPLDSRGSILYRQERLGQDGEPFSMLKFRTMTVAAEDTSGPVWAAENDPRITRIGKWLRKFRIDELPQLINVLRGQMSLVGPRPERAAFIARLAPAIPFYAERMMVKPGITGWAQVRQPYAASDEAARRKLQADLYYIKHMSFLTDLYICLMTVRIVLLGQERVPATVTRAKLATRSTKLQAVAQAGP
jgi:exopolysaccharide biosynthesis polyprenyl glycosylphosphotransferase